MLYKQCGSLGLYLFPALRDKGAALRSLESQQTAVRATPQALSARVGPWPASQRLVCTWTVHTPSKRSNHLWTPTTLYLRKTRELGFLKWGIFLFLNIGSIYMFYAEGNIWSGWIQPFTVADFWLRVSWMTRGVQELFSVVTDNPQWMGWRFWLSHSCGSFLSPPHHSHCSSSMVSLCHHSLSTSLWVRMVMGDGSSHLFPLRW